MSEGTVLITLLGMALVTYLPRLLPAWFLRGKQLPAFVKSWLKYVPVAVLAALLLPSLMVEDGGLNLDWNNLYFVGFHPGRVCSLEDEEHVCHCADRHGAGCAGEAGLRTSDLESPGESAINSSNLHRFFIPARYYISNNRGKPLRKWRKK